MQTIQNRRSFLARMSAVGAVGFAGARTSFAQDAPLARVKVHGDIRFFMQGAARSLFVPLSLAVGFSMLASYILSSTFVPVLCVWLLKQGHAAERQRTPFDRLRERYERVVSRVVGRRWSVVGVYLVACLVIILAGGMTQEYADELFERDLIDLAAFGQPFIANPDLVARLQNGWPLTAPDPNTYYGGGAEGYLDYPRFTPARV